MELGGLTSSVDHMDTESTEMTICPLLIPR